MCVRRYVLYRCGHEGRQLGYSYCRFQEALDRLSDREIAGNHPIIHQHQGSCRKISSRRSERRNRNCGQCSRIPRSSARPSNIKALSPVSEEAAVEADDEDTSYYPLLDDADSEWEFNCLPRVVREDTNKRSIEGNDDSISYPPPQDGNMDGETAYTSLSGDDASDEETDNLSHCGNGDSGNEIENPILLDSDEQRAYTESNDDFHQIHATANTTPQPPGLPHIDLARKASGSNCSTCSESSSNDRPCSPGSEIWNEDYQGERATTAVFARPRGESFRVVDVVAASTVNIRDRGEHWLGEEEEEWEEEEHIGDVEVTDEEMVEIFVEEKREEDPFERPEGMLIVVPRLRRMRKSVALRESK